MTSNIPLETAAIFFLAKLYQKQGISSEYVMVDFMNMDLIDLWGVRTENYKIKISSNLGPSANEAKSFSLALLDKMSIEHFNVDRVLPECAI